jgi:5'-nucleotidase
VKYILVTNDDGIESPGLWAAVKTLLPLGKVIVAAPREQQTSTGRSMPVTSDGHITRYPYFLDGQEIEAYAIGGTPAQSVLHAILEIMPEDPDLVVSGINYGENVGSGVTISGTVGAALEAGSQRIPALAVSLQMLSENWFSYENLDFSTAAHYTAMFARSLLAIGLPIDVDLLKIEIPASATIQTPWRVTRQSRVRYYSPYLIREGGWDARGYISARIEVNPNDVEPDSDVQAVLYDQVVSVTPLSIDLTSRVDFNQLAKRLGSQMLPR